MSLSWTFFCVTKHTQSLPLIAMLVIPDWRTALKAYSVVSRIKEGRGGALVLFRLSVCVGGGGRAAAALRYHACAAEQADCSPTWNSRPSGEKMVMCLER
jgi:hypothetical protein